MNTAFLRSVGLKALYVVIAAAALALANWTTANPDIGLWTLDSLKLAVATAVVAALKKFVTNYFTGEGV